LNPRPALFYYLHQRIIDYAYDQKPALVAPEAVASELVVFA